MRRALGAEGIGICQQCGEALESQDVLVTGQGRLCQQCFATRTAFVWTRADFGEKRRWPLRD